MQNKRSKDEEIYIEYADTVKHFLLSLAGDYNLAEDLTQETFYQAYKSVQRYNGQCKFSVWLCQMAKHVYFDYLKKETKIQKVDFENVEIFAEQRREKSVEERYLIKEEFQEILGVVQQARENYGQVFLLRAYEEMSFKEIGEIMGRSENWARVTYYRAKEWIRGEP